MANHCSFNWRKIISRRSSGERSLKIYLRSVRRNLLLSEEITLVLTILWKWIFNRNYVIWNVFPQHIKKVIAFSPGETLLIHMQLLVYLFRLRMFTVKFVSARKRFWIHWTDTSNPPLSAILQYLAKNITAGKINE